jgi:hypothetical protein
MGQVKDAEKGRLAIMEGWNVIHFTTKCLTSENVLMVVNWLRGLIAKRCK